MPICIAAVQTGSYTFFPFFSLRAALTTSVPAAASWTRQTQSHASGALFLSTTYSTRVVPKYAGPNQRQDSGAPCKITQCYVLFCNRNKHKHIYMITLYRGITKMNIYFKAQWSITVKYYRNSTRTTDLPAGQRPQGAGSPPQP